MPFAVCIRVFNMDTKKDALQSFVTYIDAVQKTVKKTVSGGRVIVLGPSRPQHFLDVFKKLEESNEFISLASIFSTAYGGSSSHSATFRLQNYFKRSRLYLDIINGKPVDIKDRFEELWSAFNKREVKKITIRPIDNVSFSRPLIDFGKFKIQRFSKDELNVLLEQEVCEAFYPYAVVDTEKLSSCWHIITESMEQGSNDDLGNLGFTLNVEDAFRVQRTFPDRTLQLLALFDWGNASEPPSPDKKDLDLWHLGLPFNHTVSNNLTDTPMAFPDLSGLALFPFTYFTQDGEEAEEEHPAFNIHLNESDIENLKMIIKNATVFLENIDLQKCEWEFFEIAMGSLAKAFFSNELEQFLWNIIALEALIGERRETTQNIRRRLCLIWGRRDKEKIDWIQKEFKELYDIRSALVHGSKFGEGKKEKSIYFGHLRSARSCARKTVLRFISFLSHIHKEMEKAKIPLNKYPKQKDLLLLLDYQIQNFEHEGVRVIMPVNFHEIDF